MKKTRFELVERESYNAREGDSGGLGSISLESRTIDRQLSFVIEGY